ncbi:alpha-(1-_3)-arabinofuranosyltransferase domain-containing protein [Nocardioides houyundeii]|uniref:alpha-(1->3)-arabinofuranosyltransferase domain-containing protein n=1 Tax=Nocardioides houyundeii TaxID=2045452 RepID=UPI0013B3CC86|nr:alpha-(1->3)-arabinofuranosyltransferase family protein [Nocardioides houyundeii]
MTVHRSRTLLCALFMVVVAVRASATAPVADSLALASADPRGAWGLAWEGWTASGTLGAASLSGLRELPFIAYYWLAHAMGIGWLPAQLLLRAALLCLALAGALRLARLLDARSRPAGPGTAAGLEDVPDSGVSSWLPWSAALVYAAGPVLTATMSAHPAYGLALGALPWAVEAILSASSDRTAALRLAAWLAVVGMAAPVLAVTGTLAAVVVAWTWPALRRERRSWATAGTLLSLWWVPLAAWEWHYVSLDPGPGLWRPALAELIGLSTVSWWVALVLGAPVVVAAAALAWAPTVPRRAVTLLLVVSVAVLLLPFLVPTPLRPVLVAAGGLQALACLVCWTPWWRRVLAVTEDLRGTEAPRRAALVVTAAAVVVGLAALSGVVVALDPKPGRIEADPLWLEVATWAADEAPERVLVVPVAETPEEASAVTRALGARAWVRRSPVAPGDPSPWVRREAEVVDLAVDRLVRGDGGEGTAQLLQHLGVSHVMVRNDLGTERDLAQPMAHVRSALVESDAERQHVFGHDTQSDLLDYGVRDDDPRVEIWRLDRPTGALRHFGPPLEVSGAPAVVADLADLGAVGSRPVVLRDADEASVASDSRRLRDTDPSQPWRPWGPTREGGPAGGDATAALDPEGAATVRTSSSQADLGAHRPRPDAHGWAALDGEVTTAWRSSPGDAIGAWWSLDLKRPIVWGGTHVTFAPLPGSGRVSRMSASTEEETVTVEVPPDGHVVLPFSEPAKRLRILVTEVEDTAARPGLPQQVAISEVTVPVGGAGADDRPRWRLRVPGAPGTGAWVLSAIRGPDRACTPSVDGEPHVTLQPELTCHRVLPRPGEETGPLVRLVEVPQGGLVRARLLVSPRPSPGVSRLLANLGDPTMGVSASSVAAQDLAVDAQAAADGDSQTWWRAAPEDPAPTLTLRWREPTRISGINLVAAPSPLNATPSQVRVTTPGGTDQVLTLEDGRASFAPVTTDRVSVSFVSRAAPSSFETSAGAQRSVPVGVAEIEVVGAPAPTLDGTTDELLCGSGPNLTIGEQTVPTRVTVSARDLQRNRAVMATTCEDVLVPSGDLLVEAGSAAWSVDAAVLESATRTPLEPGVTDTPLVLATGSWSTAYPATVAPMSQTAAEMEATLGVPVPEGSGWRAVAAGQQLDPVTLDGWAQGWRLPRGAEAVRVEYGPRQSLRLAGAAAWAWWALLVALATLLPERRRSRRSD